MADVVSKDSHLLRFYRGTAADSSGRTIEDIWKYDHRRLEMVHDYIQWLFPIPAASRFNPDAPVLTAQDAATFRADRALSARLLTSLAVMLDFYGLVQDQGAVKRGPAFAVRAATWLEPLNHNHLRLSRILQCLHQCGRDAEARALLASLEDIAAHEGKEAVSARTLEFWRAAVEVKRL
jgi:hypothetical protein